MILVKANESTASRRTVFFDLRDATDGITPELGEAGGQPQISTNGGAWTDTGIGTLTHIGHGRYYATITQTAVANSGDLIETRFKSANTAETPGDSIQVVAFDPADSNLGLTPADFMADVSNLGTSAGQSTIQTTQAAHTSKLSDIENDVAVIQTDTDDIQSTQTTHTASLNTIASGIASVLAKMLAYFRLALRSDSGPTSDDSVELAEINADNGSGAGDYDRTNSQEGIRDNQSSGGGGGGGTTLVVAPVAGVITQRSQRADFNLYLNEIRDNIVSVIDANGDAVDLSAKTLKIVIEDGRSETDVQLIEDGDIAVSGDDDNVITFRNSSDVTSSIRSLTWSLWDITDSPLAEVILKGTIKVERVST